MVEETTGEDTKSYLYNPHKPEPDPVSPNSFSETELALRVVSQWRAILNARLLALFALLGALAIFSGTAYDPSPMRLYAASLYALGVLWPVMALFLKKG